MEHHEMFGNSPFLTPKGPRKLSSSQPKLNNAKLKEELKKRGLSIAGRKQQLEERLKSYSDIHGVSSPLGLSGGRYESDADENQDEVGQEQERARQEQGRQEQRRQEQRRQEQRRQEQEVSFENEDVISTQKIWHASFDPSKRQQLILRLMQAVVPKLSEEDLQNNLHPKLENKIETFEKDTYLQSETELEYLKTMNNKKRMLKKEIEDKEKEEDETEEQKARGRKKKRSFKDSREMEKNMFLRKMNNNEGKWNCRDCNFEVDESEYFEAQAHSLRSSCEAKKKKSVTQHSVCNQGDCRTTRILIL